MSMQRSIAASGICLALGLSGGSLASSANAAVIDLNVNGEYTG
ncbi:hypothetical protein V0288_06970 [Pannus brasiliensis CCIBt3594]|uniref:Uncharacterized protein n=1 Tax=Pannus brasiliensis CCIBt3594 TaxID=1427578 RepID=A0AAW9QRL4_9CHRO